MKPPPRTQEEREQAAVEYLSRGIKHDQDQNRSLNLFCFAIGGLIGLTGTFGFLYWMTR